MENPAKQYTSPDLATALALLALDPHLKGVAIATDDAELVELAASELRNACQQLTSQRVPLERLPLSTDLPGLLESLIPRASGGVLLIPFPDLLRAEIAGPLHTALARADLCLVCARDPQSEPLWPGLLDLPGLVLTANADADIAIDSENLRQAAILLTDVTVSDEQIAALAETALATGVKGWRADTLAVRAARAHAALYGRTIVADEDLIVAISLVLLPRATRLPPTNQQQPPPDKQSTEQPENSDQPAEQNTDEKESVATPDQPAGQDQAEQLIAAAQASLPEGALGWQRAANRRSSHKKATPGRGRGANTRRDILTSAPTGRQGRILAARRRPPDAMLDSAATLSAALPLQRLRRPTSSTPSEQGRVLLRPDDLRWRRREAPPGVLFLLAVDTSGSMARNRLAAAKGAAITLLERAYRHRDRVALLTFRATGATLVLPPTRSTARAARLVSALPAGGGTPLAAALDLSLRLYHQERARGSGRVMLVLLTDGRANVPLTPGEDPQAHIPELAQSWAQLVDTGAASALMVDTRARFLGEGDAGALASAMHSRYLYLPVSAPEAISKAAQQIVTDQKWRPE